MLVSIDTSMVFVEACMLLDFSIQLHVAVLGATVALFNTLVVIWVLVLRYA